MKHLYVDNFSEKETIDFMPNGIQQLFISHRENIHRVISSSKSTQARLIRFQRRYPTSFISVRAVVGYVRFFRDTSEQSKKLIRIVCEVITGEVKVDSSIIDIEKLVIRVASINFTFSGASIKILTFSHYAHYAH